MSLGTFARTLVRLAVVALPIAGVSVAVAAPASAAGTVCVDSSRSGQYSSQVGQAIQVWNQSVRNVQFRAGCSGGIAIITVGQISGGSQYRGDMRGHGTIYIDISQVNQGYLPLRVVAHEMGHSLGLYDNYSGPCSELMSGGGPGTSCRNYTPNAAERSRVNQIWAGRALSGTENAVFVYAR
ncbi:snapalysin family zinc-dependent metalloprotease [Pseudonocardiaceae bacterium YIM PH 21723]|nr:snapalysin family zinc-dependent metalloprotease [Pseudonocardiaceae bacterium YIM PH 21723]